MKATVVLLGATGYLGSHLASAFVEAGYRVAVLKRLGSSMQRLEGVRERLLVFDIESDGIERAFSELGRVDAVLHTVAAYGRKGESCVDLLEANTAVPLRLLEAAIAAGTETFISSGTSLCQNVNGYALAKHQFAEWGRFVSTELPLRFVDLRIEHFYGPGDDDVKFATHAARVFLAGEPEFALTPGEQQRDFIYIDDVVSAFKVILERSGELAHGFHEFGIGTGEPVTIRHFIQLLKEVSGSSTTPVFGALPYRRNEVMRACACTAALARLGWSPTVPLAEGLRRMVDADRVLLSQGRTTDV